MNQFTIKYTDDTNFIGNPLNSDWIQIDEEKKVSNLEYTLGDIRVVMSGYKQYNHLLECVAMGSKGISKIFLMGRLDGKTEIVILDLGRKSISKCFKDMGSEYGNQILTGWKEGEFITPKTEIFRLNT